VRPHGKVVERGVLPCSKVGAGGAAPVAEMPCMAAATRAEGSTRQARRIAFIRTHSLSRSRFVSFKDRHNKVLSPMFRALCHLGFSASVPLHSLHSLRHSRAAMSGLAAAPTAAPQPPLPVLPTATPAAPMSPELIMLQQMQCFVAELARKDLAASAEREAMRAEAQAASALALAACAERERKDLAASAERAKAAEDREAVWEAKTMALQHKLDLSEGAVRARSLYNACIRDIAKRAVDKRSALEKGRERPASSVESMILSGSTCPALNSYLAAVATVNNADPAEVLKQARGMYGALSDPLHSEQSMEQQLPVALFDRDKGEEALLAFAAVVRFSGRNPSLYAQSGRNVVLLLPAPPRSCTATAEEAQAAAEAGAAATTAGACPPQKFPVSVVILNAGHARVKVGNGDEKK
jgi:hypothetical protein